MQTVKYSVPSISCNHCVHTIKTELGELDGVSAVEADASTKEVVVQYEDPATQQGIEELLAEINYPVEK